MNYKVSAASPTDELITLGQIFSEVGDYACTILDSEHLSLARRCSNRLKKVTSELLKRGSITSPDDFYEMPATDPIQARILTNSPASVDPATVDLTRLSVSDLHALYRRWPIRHQAKAAGSEGNTFNFEGRIVRELLSRRPATKNEQLQIDYCAATYANHLFTLILDLDDSGTSTGTDNTAEFHRLREELTTLSRLGIIRLAEYPSIHPSSTEAVSAF